MPPGEVMVLGNTGIRGQEDIEPFALSGGKQRAVLQRSPCHVHDGSDVVAGKYVAQLDRQTLVDQDRRSRRGLDDFIRGKREDRQNVFPPEARPRLQNLVEAQSIGQVVEQDRHGHACSTEAWRSAHDFGIGRDQIGCFHDGFCLDANCR